MSTKTPTAAAGAGPSNVTGTALSAGPFADGQIVLGCDYNPEQWDQSVWLEDIRLMREVGVTLVAINIFGWAEIEPRPGAFDFSRLDAIIELLHEAGIGINLGTGTASPPPWLTTLHPEILPVMADGTRRWPGGRQAYCPSSPVFRDAVAQLVTAVADRYSAHPALRLWHVSNELGCHNALCYCDVSAESFRGWLRAKYVSLDALNAAWATSFWSQRYGEWNEILPPRDTVSTGNPTQALDFARFSSDEVLECYRLEEQILRRVSAVPVTTNFMVTAHIRTQNYWQWAPHVDVVANDHYLDHRLVDPHQELSFAADLTRGLAGGAPWILMEQAIGAVNWQPHNLAKASGEAIRNTLSHVARGADAVCFFQWRASAGGSEKFHSALLPHAGTESTGWRRLLELSAALRSIAEVVGSRVVAEVAVVFSWECWWAVDFDCRPSTELRYLEQVHAVYRALWGLDVTVDVVSPGADLSGYRMVVIPSLYSVTDAEADSVREYVAGGGHVVMTFFSGIVEEHDQVRLGGYPGAFRELLGVRIDEFYPLAAGVQVSLDDASRGSIWTERIEAVGAEVRARYADGPLPGLPAITRRSLGEGSAWYLGTALERSALSAVLGEAFEGAGGRLPSGLAEGLEVVRRASADAQYVFLINHSDFPSETGVSGHELITGTPVNDLTVPAGTVRVVRTAPNTAVG